MSETADRYRIVMPLGEGGTATVELAVAKGPSGFSKLVVLKTLRRTLIQDTEIRRLFLNEARISARLSHPNIVQVNEVIERDGLPVIVMEYLDGQSLDQILSRTNYSAPLSLQLYAITRVLRALEYAHNFVDFDDRRIEVVHRDVSPHNVFVTYNGLVKLLDFGIAMLGRPGEVESGILQGKLHYMAPEQALSEPTDQRADLYAVGVMLWEAASGDRMWNGCDEETVLNRLANGDIPKVTPRSGTPERLLKIIDRALRFDPVERYPTAAELQQDLAPILSELAGEVQEETLGRYVSDLFVDRRTETRAEITRHLRDAGLAAVADEAAASLVTVGRPKSPRWWTYLLTLGLGLGTAGVVIVFRTRGRRVSDPVARSVPLATTFVPAVRNSVVSAPKDAEVAVTSDAARTISLTITVFPERSRVLLDGARVPNPYNARRLADGQTHTVVSEAPGFLPHTDSFSLDGDQFLTIRLEPRSQREHHGPATAAPAVEPPTRSNCDPPYYYDERGIKHYRVECL